MRTFIVMILQIILMGALSYNLWEGKTNSAILLCILMYAVVIENTLYRLTKPPEN